MPFHHLYRSIVITLYSSKSLSYSLSYPSHRHCWSHNCLHSCLIRAKRLHLSAYGRAKFSAPHNPSPRKRLLSPATGWPPEISDTSVRKSRFMLPTGNLPTLLFLTAPRIMKRSSIMRVVRRTLHVFSTFWIL